MRKWKITYSAWDNKSNEWKRSLIIQADEITNDLKEGIETFIASLEGHKDIWFEITEIIAL